ncbi:protein AIM2 [Podospora fimiseda]|uniref:Protein AIM2 n=1 Tax=Podospora fimiseda TaxID=252190 RepID=A0AAN7BKX4_9PEZI|nr:protein AIM2 [Podospora fimiseda]
MRMTNLLSSGTLLLLGATGASAHGPPSPGSSGLSSFGGANLLASTGTPLGQEFAHQNITFYLSTPKPGNGPLGAGPRHDTHKGDAILYLTDVFGIALPQNRLLVDSFARAGYLTLAPDLFQGEPASADINTPGGPVFDPVAFLAAHGTLQTDPVVETAINYLRNTLNVTRIGVAGYCFGGKYAFRFVAPGRGGDVAFTAHPSLVEESEILAIDKPLAIAAADHDELLNATVRVRFEELLGQTGERYQINVYGGTTHGFAVRGDQNVPSQKYGKEEAFVQAVRWFDTLL